MGGCAVDGNQGSTFVCNEKTIVLVGITGNGKSATGNSIIGRKVFDSRPSSAGVTSTCNLQMTSLEDGQILNVIDTPGLFDSSLQPELVGREIAKCIGMAKDGIHAVLLVMSLRNRFSREEATAVESLLQFFGGKIADYMIVVFSGADILSLNEYLGSNCPEDLQKTLRMCGNRCVVFDNMTDNEVKKSEQMKELLSMVNSVVENNDGVPYSNELFAELKMAELNLGDQTVEVNLSREDQFAGLFGMIESRLKEGMERLEKQLAEERAARVEAEAKAQEAQMNSNKQILELTERLAAAHKESVEKICKVQKEAEEKAGRMDQEIKNRQREIEELRRQNCSIL